MNTTNVQFVGWTAMLGGIIGVIGFICLILLFVVGEPFGSINDFLSIPTGLLLLPLVVALYRLHAPQAPLWSGVALVAGIAGFLSTMLGSGLLLLGRIDFQQSLVFGIGGFGLVGLWVLLNGVLGLRAATLPIGIAWSGIALGITPTLALLAVFRVGSVASGLSAVAGQTTGFAMNPLLIALFVLGGLSYAGLPVWFIVAGRLFAAGRVAVSVGAVAVR